MDFAEFNSAKAFSAGFSLAAARTDLTTFLTLVFTDRFRIRRFSFCRARFNADL